MTATSKQTELAELRQDIATLARLVMGSQGAKPSILSIIERNTAPAVETRPHQPEEQRAAVSP